MTTAQAAQARRKHGFTVAIPMKDDGFNLTQARSLTAPRALASRLDEDD